MMLALLVALCLTLLPAAGGAWAGEAWAGETPAMAQPCHGAPAPDEAPDDTAKACAEHCLMLVSAPAQPAVLAQPSVRNAVATAGHKAPAPAGLRNADAPDPRPPRG